MTEDIKNRKGAQKAVDIPSEVLSLLNTGRIETVNLTEWLVVDHYKPLFEQLSTHLSDSVRCYACYLVALHTDTPLEDKLHKLKPLVADSHFGVREII